MGLIHHGSSCSGPATVSNQTAIYSAPTNSSASSTPKEGMPDPYNFRIVRGEENGNWVVIEVHYPDCNNYEGLKILLYRGIPLTKLRAQKRLDPHFCDHKGCISPFARFEPTEEGWAAALTLSKILY